MAMDVTEMIRRRRLVELNGQTVDRATLAQRHGQVWDPQELGRDFVAIGYLAPYVVVRRKTDGLRGSLEFQPDPRFYSNWKEDRRHEKTL